MTVQFSRDGRRIAASSGSDLCLWDTATGQLIAVLGPSLTVAFSADGQRLVSASFDQTARLWDGATSQTIAILHGHSERLTGAEFSPDGTRLLSWTSKELRLWDGRTGQLTAVLRG